MTVEDDPGSPSSFLYLPFGHMSSTRSSADLASLIPDDPTETREAMQHMYQRADVSIVHVYTVGSRTNHLGRDRQNWLKRGLHIASGHADSNHSTS
jgi:hypothetical protein